MLGLWNLDWLNHNSQRAYPLSEQGTRASFVSSNIVIPDDLILALRISINTGLNVCIDKFFVKAMTITANGCAVLIGYDDGSNYSNPGNYPSVATTYICTDQPNIIYNLTGLGDFEDIVGYIAVNPDCDWLKGTTGYFLFAPDSTQLEPDCIVPMIRSISSIAINDGSSTSERYYGDIVLAAGSNVEFEVEEVDSDTTKIIVHAVATADFLDSPSSDDCVCDTYETAPCIRTINAIHPDENGNINVEGINCVSVTNGDHTLTLNDTCASPKCGCDTVTELGASVRDLEDGVRSLNNFVNRMEVSVAQTAAVIASSTLQ